VAEALEVLPDEEAGGMLQGVVSAARREARRRSGRHGRARSWVSWVAPPELQELAAVLGLLPERQRTALVLRYFCGLGEEEIGSVLGWSPGEVGEAVERAVLRLHDLSEL
jgi:DNA-directed RNA polymerase specialized sigma24 family protein